MPNERRRMDAAVRSALHEAQGGKCMYCPRALPVDLMHVDHKTPVSRNGSDDMDNLQALCSTCNLRKGSKTDQEYRAENGLPQVTPQKSIATFGRPTTRKGVTHVPVRLNGVAAGHLERDESMANWKSGYHGRWAMSQKLLNALGWTSSLDDIINITSNSREEMERTVGLLAERVMSGRPVDDPSFLRSAFGADFARSVEETKRLRREYAEQRRWEVQERAAKQEARDKQAAEHCKLWCVAIIAGAFLLFIMMLAVGSGS